MKAAVFEQVNKPFVVHNDWPEPKCGPRDAIIRVEANGICRSDWHAWVGDWSWFGFAPELPRVIGHEFSGVVEEVGKEVIRFKKGDRIVCPFNLCCNACEYCHSGHHNVCANMEMSGIQYSGGYGRYAHVPRADANLVALPETMSFVDAASMGCRFMTAFHGLVDQAQVRAGQWVAVQGCGGVGLAVVHIAAALGANVVAVDIDEKKLQKAHELGAAHTVNAAQDKVVKTIRQFTHGGAHVSVDALGITATCQNSIMSLRTRGCHLQIGLTGKEEKGQISCPMDLVVLKELRIVGSLGMQPHRYGDMLEMVQQGKLQPGKLVGSTVAIEQAGEVLAAMSDYGTVGATVVNKW